MGKRRGQAAMEFLMTYGWAILIVLIAIGVLAFFGVLNPSNMLPETCVLGPGLACADFKVVSDATGGRILLDVRNGMGKTIDIFTIHIAKATPDGTEMCGGFIATAAAEDPFLLYDGEVKPIRHAVASPPSNLDNRGINCDPTHAPTTNCCVLMPVGSTGNLACQYLSEVQCEAGSQTIPFRGSKFGEDLVITYRIFGEPIVHQRIGRLAAQVEAE